MKRLLTIIILTIAVSLVITESQSYGSSVYGQCINGVCRVPARINRTRVVNRARTVTRNVEVATPSYQVDQIGQVERVVRVNRTRQAIFTPVFTPVFTPILTTQQILHDAPVRKTVRAVAKRRPVRSSIRRVGTRARFVTRRLFRRIFFWR